MNRHRALFTIDPHDVQARLQLANQLAAQGDYDSSLEVSSKLAAQYPQLASAHFSRAMALVLLRRYDHAANAYREGLALERHPAAYRNLGKTLEKLDKRQQAIEAYRAAIELDPNDAKTLCLLAVQLQFEGQPNESRELLTSALKLRPNDPSLLFHLGNALTDQSQYAEALETYQAAARSDGKSAGIHYNIGHVLSLLERWQESIDAFKQAIALAPNYVKAYVEMGIAQVRFGDEAAAEQTLRRCVEIDGQVWEPLVGLGDLLASQDRVDEAIEVYERAAAIAENKSVYRLGLIYARLGRLTEAAERLEQAHELSPRDVQTLKFLGMVQWRRDDLEQAERAFRMVIELEPDGQDGYKFLLHVLIHRDRPEDTALLLRQWRENLPDDPIAKHLSRAISEDANDQRASNDYIRTEFDGFAESFDDVLDLLEYRAPELVGSVVARIVASWRRPLSILDAGCGTGLCASRLAPLADNLHGVDLSKKMIALAAMRGGYDQLITAELTEYLRECQQPYDVVVAADTLCYFGDLSAVFEAAAIATRASGLFCFTVEDLKPDNGQRSFHLNLTGRYSHSQSYVRKTIEQSGFCCESIEEVVLRNEGGSPVPGQLVVAVRNADS